MRSIKFNPVKRPLYTLGVASLAAVTVGTFAMLSVSKEARIWQEQVKLLPADAGPYYDNFGKSLAIDVDTVVVGADNHQTKASSSRSGAAYIYTYSGSNWSRQAKLLPDNIQKPESFGYSVAIDSDTAVIGDPYSGNPSTGAAYIFTRTGTTWSRQAELRQLLLSTNKQFSGFGYAVDIDGNTAVVAARGAAYVFTRNLATNSWSYQSELKVQNGTAPGGPTYGVDANQLIAISGDTIIYGNCIFIRNPQSGIWSQQTRLSVPSSAVAIDGDTMVIGAPDVNNGDGVTYVFARNPQTGIWLQQARLGRGRELPKLFTDYGFGSSVAVNGNTIVVGSYSMGPFRSLDSAAYVFSRSHPRAPWLQQVKLLPQDYHRMSDYGRSVGVSGNQVVVGDPQGGDSIRKITSGTAYIFTRVASSASKN